MQNCVSLTSAFERSYDLSLLTPMCQCERSSDITIITSTTDPCLHTLSFTRCTKTAALAKRMSVLGQVTHKVIRNALWKNQTHKALFLLVCVSGSINCEESWLWHYPFLQGTTVHFKTVGDFFRLLDNVPKIPCIPRDLENMCVLQIMLLC